MKTYGNNDYRAFLDGLEADELYELKEVLSGASVEAMEHDSIDGLVGCLEVIGTFNGGIIKNKSTGTQIVFNNESYPILTSIVDEMLNDLCGGTDYDSFQRYMDAINDDS